MKALAVIGGILFWTLMLGIAWFYFFSGSDAQDPIAVLQVEPAPEPAPAPSPPAAPTGPAHGIDFPPGFSITGPAPQQPAPPPTVVAPGTTLAPPPDEIGVPDLPETPNEGLPPTAQAPPPASAPPTAAPPAAAETPLPGDAPADTPPDPNAPPLPDRRSDTAAPETQSAKLAPQVPASQPEADPVLPIPLNDADAADPFLEESPYGSLPQIAPDGRRPAQVYARPAPAAAEVAGRVRVAVLIRAPDAPSSGVLDGLPPSVSVAYGAYGRNLPDLVMKARAAGHEVLLQVPLEPENYPSVDPGPHTLLTSLPEDENIKRLHWMMSRFTGYVGVINHMGSEFETSRESLAPIFEELKRRGLIYVDDGTVPGSVAAQVAGALGLNFSTADVQIDAGPSVAKALSALEAEARTQGTAIGVAKARPDIVRQLADWAGKLEAKGIVLVPVSAAVQSQRQT